MIIRACVCPYRSNLKQPGMSISKPTWEFLVQGVFGNSNDGEKLLLLSIKGNMARRWREAILPLYSALDPAPHTASSSRVPSTGRTSTYWRESRGGTPGYQWAGAPLLWRMSERVGFVLPGEAKALGRPYCSVSVIKKRLIRKTRTEFLAGPVVKGQRVMFLN